VFSVPARMDCSGEASEAVSVVRQSVLGSSSSRSGEGCGRVRGGFVMPLPSKAVASLDKRRRYYSDLAEYADRVRLSADVSDLRRESTDAQRRSYSTCASCGATRGSAHMVDRVTENGRVRLCKATKDRAACTLEVSP
jgi:hypothetical protein